MPLAEKTIYDRVRDLLSDGRPRKPSEIAQTLGEPMNRVVSIRERLKGDGMTTAGRSRWSTWQMPVFPRKATPIPDVPPTSEDEDFAVALDDELILGIKVGHTKVFLTPERAMRVYRFIDRIEPMLEPVEE